VARPPWPARLWCTALDEYRAAADIFTVVVDDLGWNNVGWHNKEMQTPNADALAKEGIILEKS
jgi:arylsulfatase A-like enzyme